MLNFLSIKVRFTINGYVYSFVWGWRDGFEIVQLDGDYDRPDVLRVIYSGTNIHDASRVIRGLVG